MPMLQTFGEDSARDFGFADGSPIGPAISGFYYMPINATITFTTNGSTGPNGPSLATFIGGITSTVTTSWASNTTYLNTSYFTGYFKWMVPFTGTYSLDAYGASGGYNGNGGNRAYGQFILASGSLLTIVLGQKGNSGSGAGGWYAGGGGGATTVSSGTTTSNEIPLIVAGGGGGYSNGTNYGGDLPSTTTSYTSGAGVAGTNYGGNGTSAGGGFDGSGGGGSSWRSGGVGPAPGYPANNYGGFGGGGAGGGNPGGGGGGFKGGFAGDPTGGGAYNRSGGSGANFNSGTNQTSGVAPNFNNNGYLVITRIA